MRPHSVASFDSNVHVYWLKYSCLQGIVPKSFLVLVRPHLPFAAGSLPQQIAADAGSVASVILVCSILPHAGHAERRGPVVLPPGSAMVSSSPLRNFWEIFPISELYSVEMKQLLSILSSTLPGSLPLLYKRPNVRLSLPKMIQCASHDCCDCAVH